MEITLVGIRNCLLYALERDERSSISEKIFGSQYLALIVIKVTLNTFEKGWENIITTLEKKTGKEYPRVKYKHKWDALKKDWVLWNKLKESETGLRWYTTKGRIAATDECLVGGVLPDDVEKLKEELSDTSVNSSSPKKNDDDDDDEDENPNLSTQDKGKRRTLLSSTQGKGKKGGIALKLTQQLSRICDIAELRNSACSVEPSSTIRNVMEHVYILDGIEKGSELYHMAARIF
ncbi:uncharacterized protein LOC142628810 [Castanea sativa]|uniref:uncharacterized protein LOC142628810 n=1 Tax=Castanea sativa TaxID=21020 RepID=UPI003F654355